jgi:hypothetical protein
LKASNGLRAQLETSDDETVTLELRRKDTLVSYEVKGEVTEAGIDERDPAVAMPGVFPSVDFYAVERRCRFWIRDGRVRWSR